MRNICSAGQKNLSRDFVECLFCLALFVCCCLRIREIDISAQEINKSGAGREGDVGREKDVQGEKERRRQREDKNEL